MKSLSNCTHLKILNTSTLRFIQIDVLYAHKLQGLQIRLDRDLMRFHQQSSNVKTFLELVLFPLYKQSIYLHFFE